MTGRPRRELLIVVGFIAASSLFFLDKPFHMDEPLFLAPARHIVVDPLHPFDFEFNWYGRSVPMASINNTPPLMLYALAAAWKLTAGREWAMRLMFVPANALDAAALYLLAGLFLSEPLWPVLILIASPAYLINMNLLYPETLALALGFLGLYALVRAEKENRREFLWASAALCGAAVFAKYGAVFLVPTAIFYLWRRGAPLKRIAGYAAVALLPIAGYAAYDRLTYRSALGSAWGALSQSADMPYSRWSHKLRSMLAFTGGASPAAAVWPALAFSRERRTIVVLAACSCILFLPYFDLAPLVRPLDRATGVVLAFGALCALTGVLTLRRGRAWDLWAPWIVSVLFVQAFLYWSVLARLILFLLPPLIFAMAGELERRLKPGDLRRIYALTFSGALALSAALSFVDARYAGAQRDLAARVAARYPGRRLWCAGHWGLQYYLERAGASELDLNKGGWDEVRPGDVVVVPAANSNILRPNRKLLADVERITVDCPLPLRLLSAYTGEGGFYSSATGFLPFSISREPLDEFDVVEIAP